MKKEILIIIIFYCFGGLCHSQNKKVDSLLRVLKTAITDTSKINTLNSIADEFINNNPDTAIYFANQAKALGIKMNYKMGIADACLNIGSTMMNRGNYEKALKYINDALKLYNELLTSATPENKSKILKGKGNVYNIIGLLNYDQSNYPEGLKNYFISLRIFEEIGVNRGIAMVLGNIGSIYEDQGNYTEALKNHLAALKIYKESGAKQSEAATLNNIGSVYDDQHNYTDALKNYFAALKINEENGNKLYEAINLGNIGNVYSSQGNTAAALKNHLASLKISVELDDKDLMSSYFGSVGIDFMKLKNFNEASRYMNKGLSLAKELHNFITF
jgi:tetratricopeptide (TPR) repeat protein